MWGLSVQFVDQAVQARVLTPGAPIALQVIVVELELVKALGSLLELYGVLQIVLTLGSLRIFLALFLLFITFLLFPIYLFEWDLRACDGLEVLHAIQLPVGEATAG